MQFDWWTFAFQLVNIAVLAWLLARFLFKPVAGIIAERKAETDRVLKEAEQAKRDAAEAEKAAAGERDRIAADRADLLQKAREDADAQRQALLEDAKAEAAAVMQKARQAAAHVSKEEHEKQLQRATVLAIAVAGRLLADLPVDARISGYPERLAEALSKLGQEERAAILSDGGGLHLVAPRALSDEERGKVDEAIGKMVGQDGSLPVEVDETLLAGLELRSRHGVIRNSLGSDLERMAKALTDHEQG
ncbi:F0F1 ATP synthase subunit delta [Oricola sp.]|uniref:F0F1 ATP synthase subunit delta n=1 Tax=Oricola sp. TaxID=1979950 RepID=UPI00320BE22C|nr:F0F1 ATP synthase subunit delta [Oricola sp.]